LAQLDGILLSVPRKDDEEGKTWLRRSKRVPRQVNSVQIPWWPPQDSYARPHAFQDEAGHTRSDPHVLGYMARQNGGFGARMSRQLSLFFFFLFSACFYVDSDCTDKWEWAKITIRPPSHLYLKDCCLLFYCSKPQFS